TTHKKTHNQWQHNVAEQKACNNALDAMASTIIAALKEQHIRFRHWPFQRKSTRKSELKQFILEEMVDWITYQNKASSEKGSYYNDLSSSANNIMNTIIEALAQEGLTENRRLKDHKTIQMIVRNAIRRPYHMTYTKATERDNDLISSQKDLSFQKKLKDEKQTQTLNPQLVK
ncbi:MAG: hypothetical protein ACK4M7_01960, partial [Burkholderiales bacterium]